MSEDLDHKVFELTEMSAKTEDSGDAQKNVPAEDPHKWSSGIAVLDPKILPESNESFGASSRSLLGHSRPERLRSRSRSPGPMDVIITASVLFVLAVGSVVIWWLLRNVFDGGSAAVIVGPTVHPDRPPNPRPWSSTTPSPTVSITVNPRGFACTYGTRSGNICISLARSICVRIGEHGGRRPSSVRVRVRPVCNIDLCVDFMCYEEL